MLKLLESSLSLASAIFERINDKEKKKYAVEAAEIKSKLLAEYRKPLADQIDSDIEKWQDRLEAINDIALEELKNYAADS